MKVSSQLHAPAALPLGKETGCDRVGIEATQKKKILPLPGLQPVGRCHTSELSRLRLMHSVKRMLLRRFNSFWSLGSRGRSSTRRNVPRSETSNHTFLTQTILVSKCSNLFSSRFIYFRIIYDSLLTIYGPG
jgi:hypothetical protein